LYLLFRRYGGPRARLPVARSGWDLQVVCVATVVWGWLWEVVVAVQVGDQQGAYYVGPVWPRASNPVSF